MNNIKQNSLLRKAVSAKVALLVFILGIFKTIPVYADDTDAIVKPLTNVNTLLGAMIAVVGGGVFFWGIVGMAGALMGSHDTSQIMNALWKIAAGALMISAATVYTFLMG